MANAKDVNVATTCNVTWGVPNFDAITAGDSPLTGAKSTKNFTGDEGIEVANDISTADVMAHQNSALVRRIITSAIVTYHVVFIENNPAVRELWYGNPEVDGKIEWIPEKSYRGNVVLDILDEGIDGKTVITRHAIADAQVTAVDSVTYSNSDATRYGVTFTAYRNSRKAVADVYTLEVPDEA